MNVKNRIYDLISYRNLKIVVFGMMILRIAFVLVTEGFNTIEDYKIAVNIANENGFVLINEFGPTAMKAPVYPYYLSVFIYLFGSTAVKIIAISQHLMIAFVPLLIYRIGTKLRNENIGLIAAFIFVLYPPLFYYPNVIEITSLFITLAASTFWYFLKAKEDFSLKNAAILGLLSCLLVLTQPVILPAVMIALAYIIIKNFNKNAFVLIAMFLSLQAVWTYRNYVEFDKFIHIKSPFWMNFYLGYLPEHIANDKFKILDEELKARMDSLINSTNDVDMEKHYKAAFLELYDRDPGLYFEKALHNVINYWWVPPRYRDNYALDFVSIRVIPVMIITLMTLIGIPLLYRKNKTLLFSLLFVMAYFTVVYCFTNPANIRYKLDIEWLQFFIAAEAFRKLLVDKRENQHKK